MEPREYIESGILELYVYGLLDETQNEEVAKMAREHAAIRDEIVSIEKAIINLSTSFSPYLSADNFEKIRRRLELKYTDTPVVEMRKRSNWAAWTGWAAAVLLLAGAGYLYTQLNQANVDVVNADIQNEKLRDTINVLEIRNKGTESALTIVRDNKNTVITLAGQTVAPEAVAKVYWNRETQTVYIDASGLPEPPEGQVYQVWSLKLTPQLTPTSIGLLENFTADTHKIFNVSNTADADAFGITLEPAGGSQTPTMEQLYTLGKV
jgi:anti-sigma-K factor RskA